MKEAKIMFIGVLLLTLISGFVFGIANFYNPQITATPDVVQTVSYAKGSNGDVVKQIQQKLKEQGFYQGSVDGIFGEKTAKAVKSFQQVNGLSADGVVGTNTAKALGVTLKAQSGGYSSSDVYLLSKCVYAEARGEPYIGQVAVAAVVLNRVKSSQFPNTISGVIYQPWAFTAVNDGQINLTPDQTAKSAALDAINGWDPSNGCLYYYNPKTATSKWILTRQVMLVIGEHTFCI